MDQMTEKNSGSYNDLGIQLSNPVTHGKLIYPFDDRHKWIPPDFKVIRSQGRLKRFTLKTIQAIAEYLQQYRIFR